MTLTQFGRIPFRPVSRKTADAESIWRYTSRGDYAGRISFADHIPSGEGQAYRHWEVDGNVYTTHEEFIDAIFLAPWFFAGMAVYSIWRCVCEIIKSKKQDNGQAKNPHP